MVNNDPILQAYLDAKPWLNKVYYDTVVTPDDVEHPRCPRALGIARCTGWVPEGKSDCGGH